MNDMQHELLLSFHLLEMTSGQYEQVSFDLDCQDIIGCISVRLYYLVKEQYYFNLTGLEIEHFLNKTSFSVVLQTMPAQFLVLCVCILGFFHVEGTTNTLSSQDSSFCQ